MADVSFSTPKNLLYNRSINATIVNVLTLSPKWIFICKLHKFYPRNIPRIKLLQSMGIKDTHNTRKRK